MTMAEHDHSHMVVPEPVPTERARLPRGIGTIRSPDRASQGQRLTPQFQRLQDALYRRSIAIHDNTLIPIPIYEEARQYLAVRDPVQATDAK